MLPGPGWLDTSEFIAGAHTLGIVHPPGHPLYMLLAKACALLIPFGSIAFRINLFSAMCGIGCALLVAEIVRHVADSVRPPDRWHVWCGAAAGLLFAATDASWLQSIRAEVYTLNALLVLAALLLALKWERSEKRRYVYGAAVLLGLALCNHHYLVIFFLPAPLLLLLLRPAGRALMTSRAVLHVAVLMFVALAVYAYLPLRAMTDPDINWTDPVTLERFYDTLSARTFQASVSSTARSAPMGDNIGLAMGMFAGQVSVVGLLAALAGLTALLFRAQAIGILLFVAFGFNVLTKGIMLIDPNNPDDYGYFLVGVALLTVGIGVLPAIVADRHRALLPTSVVVLAAGAVAMAVAVWPGVDLSRDRSAATISDATLDRVAPDAVVAVNFYSIFFSHWHAQLVDERRPDVALVHATFDAKRYDGGPYVAALRRRHPDLEPALAEFERTMDFPQAGLRMVARSRPVYVEPMPERTPEPAGFGAAGLVRKLVDSPIDDATAAAADRTFWTPVLKRLYSDGEPNREARRLLSWMHFIHATWALRRGWSRTAWQIATRGKGLSRAAEHEDLSALATGLATFDQQITAAPIAARPFRRLQRSVRRAFFAELDYLELLVQQ